MLYLCFNPLEQDFLIRQPYVLEGVKIAARHLSVGRVEVLVRVDIDPLVTEIVLEEDLGEVRDRHVLVPTYVGEYECLVLPEEAAACQGEGSHHEREDGRHKFAAHLRVRPLWPIARSIVESLSVSRHGNLHFALRTCGLGASLLPDSPTCPEGNFSEVALHRSGAMEQEVSAKLVASAWRSTIHLREGPGRFFPSSSDRGLCEVNYSAMNRRCTRDGQRSIHPSTWKDNSANFRFTAF